MEEGSGDRGEGVNHRDTPNEEDEAEAKCKAAIEVEKRVYKGSFQVRAVRCFLSVLSACRYERSGRYQVRYTCNRDNLLGLKVDRVVYQY